MDLKTFIKKVIQDVVEALDEAKTASKRELHLSRKGGRHSIQFDLAVTIEEERKNKKGGGIQVLGFMKGGAEGAKSSKNATVSRITFGIDIEDPAKIKK